MKALRIVYGLLAVFGVPFLGYLLGATIFIHFWDMPETEDLSEASHVVTASSCERHGPVSLLRGFGYWYECRATVENKVNGNVVSATVRGLKPELIGKPVAGAGFRRGELMLERPYQGLGGILAMVFGCLWLFVWAKAATSSLNRFTESMRRRRLQEEQAEPVVEEEPDHVSVMGGRPRWLRGKKLFVVLTVSVIGVFAITPAAFDGDRSAVFWAAACWAVLLLIIGNGVRRLLFGPWVAIYPDRLEWGVRTKKLAWAEVRRVHAEGNILWIEPHLGDAIRVGWFGDERLDEIASALREGGQDGLYAMSQPVAR